MRSAWQTRQADRQVGSGIALVVLCFLAFRLFALLLFQYGGIFGSGSDFDYYYAMAQQTDHGVWPYLSYWSEYPPVFPWLVVGVYRFAAIFGGPPSSSIFIHLLHIVLLGFDLGNLLLIYALARRVYNQTVGVRSAWVYASLFAPIYVWLGWFDPLPIFWMLLSIWLLVRRNLAGAGVACGIGIATKIFPGFVLLVAAREAIGLRPGRRGLAAVLTFGIPGAIAVVAVCLPFAAANLPIFVASLHSWFSRLPWETFWAIADRYYLFGIVPSLPARIGWPTYTTPALANPTLGAASLVVLIASVVGVYLAAWDGTPASAPALADVPRSVLGAVQAIRRVVAEWIRLPDRRTALMTRQAPRVAVAGLEIAATLGDDTRADYVEGGTNSTASPKPPTTSSLVTTADQFDDRAFRLVAFAAAIYAAIFLVTSGFSPQFMLWLVPFAVILLPSAEAFVWVTALTLVVIVGERYLYYWYFPPDGLVLSGIVLLRSLLLIGFLGEVLWGIGNPHFKLWPRLRFAAIWVTVVAFLAVSGLMLKTFADGGWGRAVELDPSRIATSSLRKTTDQFDAIVTFQVVDYRNLAPGLGDRAFYLLTDERFATPAAAEQTMRALASTHSGFVVVDRGPETASESAASVWLTRYGTQISSRVDPTGLRTTRYQIVPGLAWPATPPAVAFDADFGDNVQLLGYSLQQAADTNGYSRSIDLVWKPVRQLATLDLVLTPVGGSPRLGHIGSTYPTNMWLPGEVVIDREPIPVGTTALSVGWRSRSTGEMMGYTTISLGATTP